MRTLGPGPDRAARGGASWPPSCARCSNAYCAGFNAGRRGRVGRCPAEFQLLRLDFEPWRPADMLAGAKLLSFGLSTNWERELLRADLVRELGEERRGPHRPDLPLGQPGRAQARARASTGDGLGLAEQIGGCASRSGWRPRPAAPTTGRSAGERSATGGALLAGDPHLPSGMPGIWHQCALELGDRFCRGASMPGIPGITMGQNNDVAWTFTNVMADVEDLFVERIDGERYEFEGEWRDLEVVEEEIVVKGRDEPVRLEVRITHHGPIVNEALGADAAQPLALRWAALDAPGHRPRALRRLRPHQRRRAGRAARRA